MVAHWTRVVVLYQASKLPPQKHFRPKHVWGVGLAEGSDVVGPLVGGLVVMVGLLVVVGDAEGNCVGGVGGVGLRLGSNVGLTDGRIVGRFVGNVGLGVGTRQQRNLQSKLQS